ncbi:MAG: nucleotide exchange factor GrpE [bacterium]|nr:nucleotide exchange factor GrpE [bacterium]
MSDVNPDEEVNFEPDEELGDAAAAAAKVKKLKDELADVKAQRQEYLDGWQRCKADSVNLRKETLANAERLGEKAKEGFIEDIIPALDGFDMAASSPAWASVDAQWRSGVEQIRGQLLDALSRHGVERFGNVGEKFDHALHEAVQEDTEAAGEPHAILRVLRYGYRSRERILRPAQVIIKSS